MQPDNRISTHDLGYLELNGKRYVIHDKPGCPRNACIERFDGYLRCWACHTVLTDKAAEYVVDTFEETEKGAFVFSREKVQAK